MNVSPRVQATERLRQHLDQFDWSGQTPGRRNILQAFLALATTKGYAAVTMRTLGKEVELKAPSLYAHFPGGREEIVAESLRWHYHRFGTSVLQAVDGTRDAGEFLDAIVRVHVEAQLTTPENNLWDILVATDAAAGFLPSDVRADVDEWLRLYAGMFEAAAFELGFENVATNLRVISTILDGARNWCGWNGNADTLETCVNQGVLITRSLLSMSLVSSKVTNAASQA
ncbi:TetR/AcrR family transcriptional regulator [Nocardia jiangxiensis]|uniref:TetR/AcrR family transcriptional regulator n=1 Tax=Nocardia jiangxiensis TaxID=282685 RepID=A0ABW6SAN8_9NOCA|nr:TetR/AcrR family transcriptional regulator [Nocardia jiangxiensis]